MQRKATRCKRCCSSLQAVAGGSVSRAHVYESLIRQQLSDKGLLPVAESVGCDKATISRLQTEHLSKFCGVLDALDLKVTPGHYKCYPADEVEMMFLFAKKYMAQMESPRELEWGEE